MVPTELSFERRGIPALWLLLTCVGWALVPLTLLQGRFETYAEIIQQLPVYALVGLLLGATTGLGQALVWKALGQPAGRWWLATTLGFSVALPLALVVVTLIPSISFALRGGDPWFLPLTQPGSWFIAPLLSTLALFGAVVGVAQWIVLRRFLKPANYTMALLWVNGVWLSLAVGLFVGALADVLLSGFGWPAFVPAMLGRIVGGAAIGMLTGGLLTMLMRNSRRLSAIA